MVPHTPTTQTAWVAENSSELRVNSLRVRRCARALYWVAALSLVLANAAVFAREKTDKILLANGDSVTGEIKSLERGLLSLSTTAMSVVSLEWKHISRIDSVFTFQVELADGRILIGVLKTATQTANALDIDGHVIPLDNIVRISAIESRLWDRFRGSVSVGYNYTKSSESEQINMALDSTYRGETTHADINMAYTSVDDSSGDHDRADISFTVRRPRPNRWYGAGILQGQSNEELGIELRVSAGGGYGRYLWQATDREFAVTGGAILTREWLIGTEPNETEVEGILELSGNYYVFDTPKVSFSSQLLVYPGFTDWGRVRSDLDLRLRWELINDFFFQLQFYGSYDNKPPSHEESTTTTDYGVTTSIAYDF